MLLTFAGLGFIMILQKGEKTVELVAQIYVWTVWRRSFGVSSLCFGPFARVAVRVVWFADSASLFHGGVCILSVSDAFEKYLSAPARESVVLS